MSERFPSSYNNEYNDNNPSDDYEYGSYDEQIPAIEVVDVNTLKIDEIIDINNILTEQAKELKQQMSDILDKLDEDEKKPQEEKMPDEEKKMYIRALREIEGQANEVENALQSYLSDPNTDNPVIEHMRTQAKEAYRQSKFDSSVARATSNILADQDRKAGIAAGEIENKVASELGETIDADEAQKTLEQARENPTFRERIKNKVALILGAIMLAGASLGAGAYISKAFNQNNQPGIERVVGNDTGDNIDDTEQGEKSEIKNLTGYEELDRQISGNFDDYDNTGCFNSEGKVSDGAFGNPNAVLEAMGVNPNEATPEQKGTAREFLAYSMAEAAAPYAMAWQFADFKNLGLDEAIDKIHNMTQEEKSEFTNQLKAYFSNTESRDVTLNGSYNNGFMSASEDGSHGVGFKEDVMVNEPGLEQATPLPDGSTVTFVSKEKCLNPQDQIVIKHTNGTETIWNYVKKVIIPNTPTPTPDTPTPTPNTPTPDPDTPPENPRPEETLQSKNKEALIKNAGNPGKREINNAETPPTTEAENTTNNAVNFQAIEQQRQTDQAAAKQAEQTKQEQAAREAEAAKQAEARRQAEAARQAKLNEEQRQAEAAATQAAQEAAARAVAEAAAKQASTNPPENEWYADRDSRNADQIASDSAGVRDSAESTSHADDTVSDRQGIWNSGDF